MPLADRVFWVALTIFGAFFALGLTMLIKSGHPFIALILTLVGLVGLLFLIREQFQGRTRIAAVIRAIRRNLTSANVEEPPISEREAKKIIGRMLDEDPMLGKTASAYAYFQTSLSMGEHLPLEWLNFGAIYALHPTLAADRKIGRLLMLRFQPDTSDPATDVLLLILYGYKRIYGSDEVGVEVLEKALWESGVRQSNNLDRLPEGSLINVDEIVRKRALKDLVSPKFRLSEGGAYRLTEQGERAATVLFEDMANRA